MHLSLQLCNPCISLTGFSLYAQHAPGGIMHRSLGFMYAMFSSQGMRLAHHASMWLIFGFVINHIYSAWLFDIKEHGSEISSIFSGYKFTVKKEK
jgi:Ni/Fe-hydrogenase 1 B-type cytochrome subunit